MWKTEGRQESWWIPSQLWMVKNKAMSQSLLSLYDNILQLDHEIRSMKARVVVQVSSFTRYEMLNVNRHWKLSSIGSLSCFHSNGIPHFELDTFHSGAQNEKISQALFQPRVFTYDLISKRNVWLTSKNDTSHFRFSF